MTWVSPCSCFRIAVRLVRRIHPLEQAQASATLHFDATSTTTNTSFQIRGLAPNGRDFSPGGVTVLTGWVSDPAPFQGEYQHFCAWTHTIDFLPVPHERVGFVAHYANRTVRWNPGSTGPTGIYCSHRSIGKARSGYPVKVDIYAGPLSTQTSFTPRP